MRKLQRVTYFLLGHRWLSLVATFFVTFLPIVGIVGILYAGFVTLRKSIYEGGMLALAATIPYVLIFFTPHIEHFFTGDPVAEISFKAWIMLGVVIVSNLLTWVFAVMLRRHSTWSQILQVAALMGVLVISLIHLIYPDVVAWWGEQLTQLAAVILPSAGMTAEMQAAAINEHKGLATGFMTAMVLLNALLQVAVSRWWQAAIYHHGMLHRELHNIRLSSLAGCLFLLSVALCFYGNSVVVDIMPVLYLLFAVAGLSVLHYLFALMKSGTKVFWMLLMYVILIFSWPNSMYFLATIGLADIWMDIRKRLNKASI